MQQKLITAAALMLVIFGAHVIQTEALFFGTLIGAALAAKALIVAKLVAGAALLGWYSKTFGYRPHVYKRSLSNGTDSVPIPEFDGANLERLFAFVANNDEQFCVPRIICEIHAQKNNETREKNEIEAGIIDLFRYFNATEKPSAAAVQFKQAAILGRITDLETCYKVYDTCTLEQGELLNVIQAANQLDK